jgi:RNA polymerase sigma-70 factor (ECF subfamily)
VNELNDENFVQRLITGDPSAFQVLFNQIVPKLCAFIERDFDVTHHDAEELAVDTMVKVHKAVADFMPNKDAKLTTWIFKIAKHTAIDYLRQQQQATRVQATSFNEETFGSKHPSVRDREDENATALTQIRMRRAFDSLSEQDQNILRMRQCMSYEEITMVESLSEDTLRQRHKRALGRLRAAYEGEAQS